MAAFRPTFYTASFLFLCLQEYYFSILMMFQLWWSNLFSCAFQQLVSLLIDSCLPMEMTIPCMCVRLCLLIESYLFVLSQATVVVMTSDDVQWYNVLPCLWLVKDCRYGRCWIFAIITQFCRSASSDISVAHALLSMRAELHCIVASCVMLQLRLLYAHNSIIVCGIWPLYFNTTDRGWDAGEFRGSL